MSRVRIPSPAPLFTTLRMKSKQPLRILGLFFMAMAIFSLAGGHWALLQGVAWANMIHEYSAHDSLQAAIGKTFSGNYRCSLCKKIAEAKQKEKKSTAALDISQKIKISFWSNTSAKPILSARAGCYPQIISSHYRGLSEEPPTQPPRSFSA